MQTLEDYYNLGRWRSLALTFDTDWAPEYVLSELIDRLTEYGFSATFFATNPSPCLEAAANAGHIELALHPNFHPGSSHGDSPDAVLARLLSWFPQSVGVRSHGLVHSSTLLRSFNRFGLRYDASAMLPDHPYLQVFSSFYDLVRIPYYWSDASHVLSRRAFDCAELSLETPGLKVVDFHPMLWYLNSTSMDGYESVKQLGTVLTDLAPDDVTTFVETGAGVGTLFDQLCNLISQRKILTYTLAELAQEFTHHQQPWNSARGYGTYDPFVFHGSKAG